MAILPSAIMGLQHCLAMVGGLITPSTIMGTYTPSALALQRPEACG